MGDDAMTGGVPPALPPEGSGWSGAPEVARASLRVSAEAAGPVEVSAPVHRGAVSGHRRRERWPAARGVGPPSAWPLLVVLAVQAALSLRLVWADTAFEDEATYLWAGHLEWAHWLHGAVIPPFAPYFSGAPVDLPADRRAG